MKSLFVSYSDKNIIGFLMKKPRKSYIYKRSSEAKYLENKIK